LAPQNLPFAGCNRKLHAPIAKLIIGDNAQVMIRRKGQNRPVRNNAFVDDTDMMLRDTDQLGQHGFVIVPITQHIARIRIEKDDGSVAVFFKASQNTGQHLRRRFLPPMHHI